MRSLTLYLRSRQTLATVAIALACVVALGVLASNSDAVQTRFVLVLFAVTVAASVAATGLAGPDPALDRTAAVPWWWRRTAHVAAIGVLAAAAVVLSRDVPDEVVVRDAVGLTGLAALGATLFGGGLAWCLPTGWTAVAVTALLASPLPAAPLLTWPVQPPDTPAATVAAGVLGAVGVLAYAVRGARVQ